MKSKKEQGSRHRFQTLAIMSLSKILMDKVFTHDSLVHAVAGAAGATVAMTVFYPLDTIRSRLQVEEGSDSRSTAKELQCLLKSEGLEGLYRGIHPVLQSLWCSNFVYFYSFHGLRAIFSSRDHSVGRDLSLAAIAGIINVFLTTPMWVVNTRMKLQGKKGDSQYNYESLTGGMMEIARREGLLALWSSTIPSLILVSNPSIQFMVYEALKRRLVKLGVPLNSASIFSMGAVSKCIATILTYPLQLVQSKMRYNNDNKTMIETFIYVGRNFGPKGFFKGLESKLLQTVLTAALMFMTYEKIAALVFAILKGRKH